MLTPFPNVTQGWNLAFTDLKQKKFGTAEEVDAAIAERVTGEMEVHSQFNPQHYTTTTLL